jgi:seryl-tRNA synthetase
MISQHMRWSESGCISLSGPLLDLFQQLDRFFLKIASQVSAQEFYFPTMIPVKTLKRIDYFKSFPHLIHFTVSLQMQEDNLREFSNSPFNEKGEIQLTQTSPVCDCLTPAACYHFYSFFEGQDLSETRFLTTRAFCYRQETHYQPLRRQRNFNMREIVCLGKPEEVKAFLQKYHSLMEGFFTKLGFPVQFEVATDPFFDPTQNPKFIMQTLDPVKKEMVFGLGTEKELSLGSVNFHKNYFGEAFSIKCQGEEAFSGCVAFGMERWIWAWMEVFGEDPAKWPSLENVV